MDLDEIRKLIIPEINLKIEKWYSLRDRRADDMYLSEDTDWSVIARESREFCEVVDSYGGEGMGDDYWHVVKVPLLEDDSYTYIKFGGHYDSWNGTEWDSSLISEVKPVQKTITVYE